MSVHKPRHFFKEKMTLDQRRQLILVCLAFGWIVLYCKTVQIQVFKSSEYKEELAQITGDREMVEPERGQILDRNGDPLAVNLTIIDTQPKMRIFKKGYKFTVKSHGKDSSFLLTRDSIEVRQVPVRSQNRFYPWGHLAANLLGGVNRQSGHGSMGLEASMDEKLYGRAGWTYCRKDYQDKIQYGMDCDSMQSMPGYDVVLTIDRHMQEIAEKILNDTVPKMQAEKASAIIVDVHNGEILAMANYPSNDPNDNRAFQNEWAHNYAIQTTYEPGSIMKLLTAAAALESKSITEKENWNPMGGLWEWHGKKITDDHKTAEILSLPMAFAVSSNIIFAQIGIRAGERNLYRYFRNFGIGMRSGIELPGELPGFLKETSEWSGVSLATMSYGYEVKVTPLQMAMAYAAVANGGTLFRPKIIRGWRDPVRNTYVADTTSNKIRDVISPETAHILQKLAREVVENEKGTGHGHRSNIVSFAGKTGTANVWDSVTRHYSNNINNGSFAGWIPAENPQYAVLVVVQKPQFQFRYGASSAGPIFKDIAEKIYLSPDLGKNVLLNTSAERINALSDFRGKSAQESEKILRQGSWNVRIIGEGDKVLGQEPASGTIVGSRDTVTLWLTRANAVPNLSGMNLGQARAICTKLGLQLQWNGRGRVRNQWPEAGTTLNRNEKISLNLGVEMPVSSSSSLTHRSSQGMVAVR